MFPCRLIVDPPQDGAWNMALDEALLEDAAAGGSATLRFYQWREPTLSLGYFQSHKERDAHAPSRRVAMVRRLSGGGALLHDRELTYSLCLPPSHPQARHSERLYAIVHRAIIGVIAQRNLAPALHADQAAASAVDEEPFLCFARRTAADVVLCNARPNSDEGAAAKIVGSAQRRRRGAVLQHGAILLNRSPAAPELPGVNDFADEPITAEQLSSNLQQPLAEALDLKLFTEPLRSQIRETAQR
ncbi:MAG TPA: hypothetical protein VF175_13605, partial [Lacipirellula sp.]